MKKIIILIMQFLFVLGYSQSELRVRKEDDSSPVQNASVFCEGKLIGSTNSNGVLNFRTKCKKIDVRAEVFYDDDAVVDRKMEVFLVKSEVKVASIQRVVIENKSDPRALEILKKVNQKFKENSPNSLESYSFKSYERISFDLDEDSIAYYNNFLDKRLDSLKSLPQTVQKEKEKKDSLEAVNVMKLMKESKLFLWERAQKYLYSQKYGEKVSVLDNRMSGLNQPLYELIAMNSNKNRIPRQVAEENRELHRFFLTDTIEIDGRQNYVIRFRDVNRKQQPNRRKFNGYIYVDAQTFGIKKIESNSNKKNEGSVTTIWIPIENKWFIQKENMKLKAASTAFSTDEKTKEKENEKETKKKFGYYVFRTADYFGHQVPSEETSDKFRGYTMDVKNADGSLLDNYRTYELSEREKNTYVKIDSVGTKYKLDRKAKLMTSLLKGKFRIGITDLDIGDLIRGSGYEGFRTGIHLKFNERFHKYISPDFYVSYGFKDKEFKYGLGLDVKTTLRKNSFFRAEYYNDVMAAGKFSENLWSFRKKFMNGGINQKNERFIGYEGFKLSYENDLLNSLTAKISVFSEREDAKFDYSFKDYGYDFKNFGTLLSLKYSPNSKNIMTPTGKYTYDQGYPEVFLNYEQGLKSFGGDFSFSRFDLMYVHNFKTKIGTTGARFYSGLLLGDAPIWQHFHMNGMGPMVNEGINFNLTSYLGFATMESGKYFNDKFAGLYFTHRIPWYFKSFGKNTSSFDLVYRGIIGDMKNPEYHQFDFQKLNHLYQETGLEWNNFLSTRFNLGFFYRIGHYKTAKFNENFAVQLKLRLLGF